LSDDRGEATKGDENARTVNRDRALRVVEAHRPRAHAPMELVLDTILVVEAGRGLGPEVRQVVAAAELQGDQVIDLEGSRRLARGKAVRDEGSSMQLPRDVATAPRRRAADHATVRRLDCPGRARTVG
jgi:hypothetical protein